MNAHSPNPPTGEPIAADDGDADDKAPVPQITLITKHGAQSLMSKRMSLDADGRLKSDRPCGPGRLFCLRCKEPRRPAFDEVAFWPPALGGLRGLCLTCIGVMHRRTSVARFAAAAADLRVSFPHGDPGLSDEPPTFESREFASAVAAQMRSAA